MVNRSDAEGSRTSQTSGGVTTTYVHDPQAALSRLLTRTIASQTTRYVYAGGHLLYGETDGGELQFHHSDSRGSTITITDATGTVTDRITYGPYGETVSRTGTTATPFLFNGAMGVQTDPNGLLHMRARYYSVETRRFLNADPIGFDGGSNWYAFVSGNPVVNSDPTGLWTVGFGGTASADIFVSVNVSLGIHLGRNTETGKWSFGVLFTEGIGNGGPASASAGGFVQVTNADSVGQLKGVGVDLGGSAGEVVVVGGNFVAGFDMNNGEIASPYQGGEFEVGVGAGPIAVTAHLRGTMAAGWDTDLGWGFGNGAEPPEKDSRPPVLNQSIYTSEFADGLK